MLKTALTHIVQQNKQEIKLEQLQCNQGQTTFLFIEAKWELLLSSLLVKPAMLYSSIQESI